MRILIISPVSTHPTTAGNRMRILRMCELLETLGHEVHFMLLRSPQQEIEAAHNYWGDRLHLNPGQARSVPDVVRSQFYKLSTIARNAERYLIRKTGRMVHSRVDDKYDLEWTRRIRKCVDEVTPDAVIVEYIWSSRCLAALPDHIVKIIDTHDVFSYRNAMFEGLSMPGWFSTTPRRERKALKKADKVLAITDSEKKFFESLGIQSVYTVGHPVSLNGDVSQHESHADRQGDRRAELVRHADDPKPTYDLGFLGSLNGPNCAGWDWLNREVLPLIFEQLPGARICVAGGMCERIAEGILYPGVTLLNRVEHLRDFYSNVRIIVNPLQFGTGLKIKSVEALEYGKMLVSTLVGIDGLPVKNAPFRIADDPAGFADACLTALQDNHEDSYRDQLGAYLESYNRTIQENMTAALSQ
jgi:Glycosyl transferases group 1/Glycosyltransferase Family 4